MHDASPMKTITLGLIASIIIMAAGFLLMEGTARILENYLPHTEQTIGIIKPNPSGNASYRLKPNMEVSTLISDRLVRIKLNSLGMHWKEVRHEKVNEKTRIAFVGDSFTFGSWASDAAHGLVGVFDSMMPSQSIEVLNFGVTGYGLDDIELMITEEVTKFKPDYVVLCFFNGNDFRDTYLGINKYVIVNGTAIWNDRVIAEKVPTEFRRQHDKQTQPKNYYRRLKALLQLENLASFRVLKKLHNLFVKFNEAPMFPGEIVVENEFTSYTFWSAKQYSPVAKNAVDVTLATLDQIRNDLSKINIPILIVTIPYRDQVYVETMRGPNYDVKFPQIHVEKYAHDHGVPYLDLLPPLREYVRQENAEIYVKGDVHFNDLGHKIAGTLIAQWSSAWLHRATERQ
jgi:lysophospholipase L1-like esterase